MIELRQLRYFVAVAEELHFSRAAQRLNISQPPLSQQIAALEQKMGVKLFDRDKRNVALTKAGETLLLRARNILANASEALDEAKRIDRGSEGKLTIGYISGMQLVQISHLLRAFRKSFPLAEVNLREMNAQEQCMAVIRGEIDVGYVDVAVGSMSSMIESAKLNTLRVFCQPAHLCVAHDHPLGARDAVSIRELADLSFITVQHTLPALFDDFTYLCRKAGFSPRISQQVDSYPAAIALVAAGYGVALAPEAALRAYKGLIRLVPLEEPVLSELYLISSESHDSRLISGLKAVVQSDFGT